MPNPVKLSVDFFYGDAYICLPVLNVRTWSAVRFLGEKLIWELRRILRELTCSVSQTIWDTNSSPEVWWITSSFWFVYCCDKTVAPTLHLVFGITPEVRIELKSLKTSLKASFDHFVLYVAWEQRFVILQSFNSYKKFNFSDQVI